MEVDLPCTNMYTGSKSPPTSSSRINPATPSSRTVVAEKSAILRRLQGLPESVQDDNDTVMSSATTSSRKSWWGRRSGAGVVRGGNASSAASVNASMRNTKKSKPEKQKVEAGKGFRSRFRLQGAHSSRDPASSTKTNKKKAPQVDSDQLVMDFFDVQSIVSEPHFAPFVKSARTRDPTETHSVTSQRSIGSFFMRFRERNNREEAILATEITADHDEEDEVDDDITLASGLLSNSGSYGFIRDEDYSDGDFSAFVQPEPKSGQHDSSLPKDPKASRLGHLFGRKKRFRRPRRGSGDSSASSVTDGNGSLANGAVATTSTNALRSTKGRNSMHSGGTDSPTESEDLEIEEEELEKLLEISNHIASNSNRENVARPIPVSEKRLTAFLAAAEAASTRPSVSNTIANYEIAPPPVLSNKQESNQAKDGVKFAKSARKAAKEALSAAKEAKAAKEAVNFANDDVFMPIIEEIEEDAEDISSQILCKQTPDRWSPSPTPDVNSGSYAPKRPHRRIPEGDVGANKNKDWRAQVFSHVTCSNDVHCDGVEEEKSTESSSFMPDEDDDSESVFSLLSGLMATWVAEQAQEEFKQDGIVPFLQLRSCLKQGGPIDNARLCYRVSFAKIEIREYERTVGDNPACGSGPPITIGWGYVPGVEANIEEYEATRVPRTKKQYYLPPAKRIHLLTQEWQCTEEQIRKARREATYIQYCREKTAFSKADKEAAFLRKAQRRQPITNNASWPTSDTKRAVSAPQSPVLPGMSLV